ncbi:hypothetical protein [Marinithermus hydrothermalis]|uniref:Uncharacterized protein n=1 Tax=Marinithermus hydrothermalis (strain DSM 14884 / JCM 11576 / T1) TaxID=869210 RepID=F2NKM0_MARHT|nr:hypothetical protein [Marinithermus hydrothermalis]AEB12680.1 hypothetical protein Marky_1950 [Marinithermus hydrothermalis DSM 14884]
MFAAFTLLGLALVIAYAPPSQSSTPSTTLLSSTDRAPDVTLTLNNRGNSAWRVTVVDGIKDRDIEDTVALNETNAEITLVVGTRYRIINKGGQGFHPFEFTDQNAVENDDEELVDFEEDVVLLSQKPGVQGSFEADPAVAWVEDARGVTFTLTPELALSLKGYRCGNHTENMRGDIEL